jgi:non-heme Fe2+,alpha-ketoglutarate-dependent halogenase
VPTPDKDRLNRWYQGHVRTDDAISRIPLTRYQRVELAILVTLIGSIRPIYWFVRRLMGKQFDVTRGLDALSDIPCHTVGTRVQETHGAGYLTRDQVATFERDGVIGPLPFLSPDEATRLRQLMVDRHEADWHGDHVIGNEIVAGLKDAGIWSIKHGSLWQEHNVDQIRAIAQRPILGERLASLLGDDVVAWRTQVFSIEPGAKGTFWHSATTFVEDGDLPTLTPPAGMPPALANLNCWIALEDVDDANSCLRMVPGTHVDARLDTMLRRFLADRIGFVMSYNRQKRRRALIAVRYSGDLFIAAQLGFDMSLELVPDMYATSQPTDYPMKAGECLIFSSNTLHCSYMNSSDGERLAMGLRTTSADVGIFQDQPTIPFATGGGHVVDLSTDLIKTGTTLHNSDGPTKTVIDACSAEQEHADTPVMDPETVI